MGQQPAVNVGSSLLSLSDLMMINYANPTVSRSVPYLFILSFGFSFVFSKLLEPTVKDVTPV
jgi:hypothetical protein